MKRLFVCVAAIMLSFTAVATAQQAPAPVQPAPVKRTPIGKTEVPASNYEVITALVELQPGFKAGRHTHPGTVQAQVLEGEFLLALDGQPEKTFKAGQSLEVPDRAIHNEGAIGSVPAKLIAVYIVEKGKPLVSAVQQARNRACRARSTERGPVPPVPGDIATYLAERGQPLPSPAH